MADTDEQDDGADGGDSGQSPLEVLKGLQTTTPEARSVAAGLLANLYKGKHGLDTEEQHQMDEYETRAKEARQVLSDARDRLLSKKFDQSQKYFALAAAAGAPTYTNSPGEPLARMATALGQNSQRQSDWEDARDAQALQFQQGMGGIDQGMVQNRLKMIQARRAAEDKLMGESLRTIGTPTSDSANTRNQASADALTALAALRKKQAEHPELFRVTGSRPPSGFEEDPDNPGQLRPIKGGPKDPMTAPPMGSREAVFLNRVLGGANQAVAAIKNITELPVGASTGVLGIGASPGHSLFSSVKGALTNEIASQDVQDYNTMLPGIERNLASIESAGLVPSNTFMGSFGKLELRQGDTQMTKLRKLAEMRQIIEKGLEPSLENPRVQPSQKELIKKIIDMTKQAVPFEHSDITRLQRAQQTNPSTTLNDLIKQKITAKPGAPTAPPVPGSKPKSVTQNGHTYTLNDATGEYE
jgi:hypothetical protein